MTTTPKQFANDCINIGGYNNNRITGWEYIRQNLHKLDYILKTDEYKKQNGMKYLCMPFLTKACLNQELTDEENHCLETVWYLNNERERKEAKEKHKNEMIAKGFEPLTEALCQMAIDKKQKLHIITETQNDWATIKIDKKYTPQKWNNNYVLLPPKARSRGHHLHQFGEDAFAKLTN